jgi:hypothetical protein
MFSRPTRGERVHNAAAVVCRRPNRVGERLGRRFAVDEHVVAGVTGAMPSIDDGVATTGSP